VLSCVSDIRPTASTPHPEDTADEATLANWARIRKELEARNYSMPTNVGRPDSGTFGVDVSSWVGELAWLCMRAQGYSFAVVREFQETCNVDPNGVHTVANAYVDHMQMTGREHT
jgi:hypothetical protein